MSSAPSLPAAARCVVAGALRSNSPKSSVHGEMLPYSVTQGLAVGAAETGTGSTSGCGLYFLMDASTASLCGPVYQGMVRTSVAGAPEARTTARPRSSSARLETSKMRSLPSWRERLDPDFAGGDGDIDVAVVADQVRERPEEAFFGDAAAVDLDVRGGPDFPHVRLAPEFDALGPGLQDAHDDQALGAVVAELVRQPGPADDVGQLVEGEQCRLGQASAAALGAFFHGLGDGHRQCRGERGGGAGPFLGEDVDRLL